MAAPREERQLPPRLTPWWEVEIERLRAENERLREANVRMAVTLNVIANPHPSWAIPDVRRRAIEGLAAAERTERP